MAKRTIEETFHAIEPSWLRGVPSPPTIGVGMESGGNDFSTSLSQAGQQIAQLQSTYQQQAALIQANTQAIQGNTSAQSNRSAGSVAASVASSVFGGFGLGLLSPLISGISSLFGGGNSSPAPLPVYVPPPPVSISGAVYPSASNAGTAAVAPSSNVSQANAGSQITVNVNAMDSKSFMDHSADIADAVREAMLNMHPINSVVTSL